jgi:H+/Cl- antiporter ClcA
LIAADDDALSAAQVIALLLVAPLLMVALQPYQWISALGFRLQQAWPLGGHGTLSGSSLLLVFSGTLLVVVLANGRLRSGRGGGLTTVQAMQLEEVAHGPTGVAALNALNLRHQLTRLPLLVLTHGAGLAVGLESPSASLGASLLLALRPRLAPLRQVPLPVLLAMGAGAGLGIAFHSELLGVTYAAEELCRKRSAVLINGTLLVTGLGVILSAVTGLWDATPDAAPAHHAGIAILLGLEGHLLGPALLLTAGAGWLGGLFTACTAWLADRWNQWLWRREGKGAMSLNRLVVFACLTALVISLAAVASEGWSLNDGQLLIVRMAYGDDLPPLVIFPWRLLASVMSIAIGCPGGVMHDAMSLGALLAGPWIGGLPPLERQLLVWTGATALFSGACRTPLFCALFVTQIAGNAALLPVLLLVAALAAPLGRRVGAVTWNEVQLERWLAIHKPAPPTLSTT